MVFLSKQFECAHSANGNAILLIVLVPIILIPLIIIWFSFIEVATMGPQNP